MPTLLKRNTRGSAILIALVVLIILTIMSTVFLEKLLGFAKASEGIENSNVAYYNALGIIEEALYTGWVDKYTPWMISNSTFWDTTSTGKSLTALTGGNTIPLPWNGNSPYDKNWNIISLGDPVQLVIPSTLTNNSLKFSFRIPKVESTQTSTGVNPALSTSGIIMWTFTSTGNSLFASGETNIFRWMDLNGAQQTLELKNGTTNTGVLMTFQSFYTAYKNACTNYKCTLKLSMLRSVSTDTNANINIPFLEYKVELANWDYLPQKFMKIEARGFAYGFMRSRIIEIPQITTNNALDFAVLQ